MTEKNTGPQSLNEEFYQISEAILSSFPKFRLPLNIYVYDQKVSQLIPYYKAGTRLHQDKKTEMGRLSREGLLFVSRSDHKIYAKHIRKQLDLVLMDKHLTTEETVYIIRYALTDGINMFYDQPVSGVLEKLNSDILVLTEYIWTDREKTWDLLQQLHQEYSSVNLSYNSGIIGLAVFLDQQGENCRRKAFNQLALGLFTHLLGLTRVPRFILEKTTSLTREEQLKITNYPVTGASIMRKLDIMEGIVLNCHLEHKELLDGSGTPRGMKGTELSLHGKLTSLVHAFCEATMTRNSKALPMDKAVQYMTKAPKKFDSSLARGLEKIILTHLKQNKQK